MRLNAFHIIAWPCPHLVHGESALEIASGSGTENSIPTGSICYITASPRAARLPKTGSPRGCAGHHVAPSELRLSGGTESSNLFAPGRESRAELFWGSRRPAGCLYQYPSRCSLIVTSGSWTARRPARAPRSYGQRERSAAALKVRAKSLEVGGPATPGEAVRSSIIGDGSVVHPRPARRGSIILAEIAAAFCRAAVALHGGNYLQTKAWRYERPVPLRLIFARKVGIRHGSRLVCGGWVSEG